MLKQNIITIGGSSGSLVPLTLFFDHSTLNNASYVVIRHTPIDYQSKLNEILRLHTGLQVAEATDGISLENGKVYYPPPKFHLIIKEGCLHLVERIDRRPNYAIDLFLESLAFNQNKVRSVAVILSGEGNDGMKGATAISKSGGLVIVQAPESCDYPSLPISIIESSHADFVLFPQNMPKIIQEYVNQSNIYKNIKM